MREWLVPPLSWPLSLSDRQLGLDLVEVEISGIRVDGDATHALAVLGRLNRLQVCTSDGGRVQLFNRPHCRAPSRPLTANIRTETKTHRGQKVAPVISGRLVASIGRLPTHRYEGSEECVNIKLELKLNVPRFIAAQSFRPPFSPSPPTAVQPFALAGRRQATVENEEVAFGTDGNILMGSQATYRYAAAHSSVVHLNDLISSILDTITGWLNDCIESRNNQVTCHPVFTLSKAEWYAEFWVRNPRGMVARFVPVLSRQCRVGNIFRRRLTGQVRTFGPHSEAMQIELAAGVKQTTYSKTSRRIRFELKYGRSCFRRLIGRRTRLTLEQLSSALDRLRGHAAGQLRRIFSALTSDTQPKREGMTRDELVLYIGSLSDDRWYAEEILHSLRNTGRVVSENGSILRSSITNLVKARVLRFVRHGVYTVTEDFEGALHELMTEPGAAMEPRLKP